MSATTYPDKMTTPDHLQMLKHGNFDSIDHGMNLVHDINGEPRNYLHEVSVPSKNHLERHILATSGFQFHVGWYDRDGEHRSSYVREVRLSAVIV